MSWYSVDFNLEREVFIPEDIISYSCAIFRIHAPSPEYIRNLSQEQLHAVVNDTEKVPIPLDNKITITKITLEKKPQFVFGELKTQEEQDAWDTFSGQPLIKFTHTFTAKYNKYEDAFDDNDKFLDELRFVDTPWGKEVSNFLNMKTGRSHKYPSYENGIYEERVNQLSIDLKADDVFSEDYSQITLKVPEFIMNKLKEQLEKSKRHLPTTKAKSDNDDNENTLSSSEKENPEIKKEKGKGNFKTHEELLKENNDLKKERDEAINTLKELKKSKAEGNEIKELFSSSLSQWEKVIEERDYYAAKREQLIELYREEIAMREKDQRYIKKLESIVLCYEKKYGAIVIKKEELSDL